MSKRERVPVHRLNEQFAGIYLAPFGGAKPSQTAYESSQPHRHDFYYCVLLEKGDLQMVVDFQPVHLTGRSLYLSYPGQIHQVTAAQMEQGWYFAFAPAFLDEPLRDTLDQFLSEVIVMPLSPEQATRFSALLQHLHAVQNDHPLPFRQSVLHHLTAAFGYQLATAYLAVEQSDLRRHSARSVEITKSFKQLLRQHYKLVRRPADFAARLHLTARHLNDTVRQVTGFPVTYYIQQTIMREAQRLLADSTLTVSEIAYTLGFEDAKYFSRLFSQVVGVSPGAFRKGGNSAAAR